LADSESSSPAAAPATPRPPVGNPWIVAVAAWLIPGAGHLLLKRWRRALLFCLVILVCVVVGCHLDGNLYRPQKGEPLTYLATLSSMGMGILYYLLRWGIDYQGDVAAASYEYGTAFLLTAGLMNLLVVLDAWDVAAGHKE
jgi:hypothetical protein